MIVLQLLIISTFISLSTLYGTDIYYEKMWNLASLFLSPILPLLNLNNINFACKYFISNTFQPPFLDLSTLVSMS